MQQPSRRRDFERPEIIRPPSEWQSYFLPLTSGCSNHSCTFCNYYQGSRLRIRPIEEVEEEIDALAAYVKHGIKTVSADPLVYGIAQNWDRKKIFLQDGDALVYPFPRLVRALSHISDKLPTVERIGTYATPQDVLRRSAEELRHLRDRRLDIVYMGLESGDDEVLKRVGKGVDSAQAVQAGQRVKEAGITLSVTIILGLGGVEGSARHAAETARALTAIDPDYAGALTLTLVPGTPIHEQAQRGELRLLSPFQTLEELKTIVEKCSLSNCFFSSMHASNYFSLRGTLPQDKNRMLRDLDVFLRRRDPTLLRPEYLRGL